MKLAELSAYETAQYLAAAFHNLVKFDNDTQYEILSSTQLYLAHLSDRQEAKKVAKSLLLCKPLPGRGEILAKDSDTMNKRHAVQFLWMKKEYQFQSMYDQSGLLIEQLRYAQLLSVVKENDEHYVLRMYAPAVVPNNRTSVWAEHQSERMKSFGINAEVVKLSV